MKWYDVELEIPIYGKTFEIIQASDLEIAKKIALRKSEKQFNFDEKSILVTKIREIKL